jgi:hypothetical protein
MEIIVRGKPNKPLYWTDKKMRQSFGGMEDHQYKHINRSLGMRVESKEHFRKLLEEGGYVSYEDNVKQVESKKDGSKKDYKEVRPETMQFIQDVKATADSKGRITPTDKLIEGMEKVGVNFYNQNCPSHYKDKGGFNG